MSKFEQYLLEINQLEESVSLLLEGLDKLGSLDAFDAHDLGLPANTPLNKESIIKGFYSKYPAKDATEKDVETYLSKLKRIFRGVVNDNDIKVLKQWFNERVKLSYAKDW